MKRRLVFSFFILIGLIACEKDYKHFLTEGQMALQAQKFDEALVNLDKALELDKDNYQALWNKSLVYRRQGDFVKEGQLLEKILAIPAHAKRKSVVKPALEECYRKQADELTGKDAPAAEALLRKAIELNKGSEANKTLAELLSARGKSALNEAKFKEAADLFTEASKLRISKTLDGELKERLNVAEFMSFKANAFMPRFKKLEPQMIEAGQYDEKTKLFTLTTIVEVEGRKKTEEAEKQGEALALKQLNEDIAIFIWKLAEKPRPEGAFIQYPESEVNLLEKGFTEDKRPLKYQIKVNLKLDDVIPFVRNIDEGKFAIQEPEKTPEADKKPEEEKKPEPAKKGKKGKKGSK
ncbi:hypothetical protein KKF91_12130 [Myxococcota bacterium]|nr:hypothetical protein [Myxococcota bacterium]MBU1431279.1 hypothetical protein [Myxococcota bacterium]MBU1900457.1 hypothetical protein [Myxococcota bacterium]